MALDLWRLWPSSPSGKNRNVKKTLPDKPDVELCHVILARTVIEPTHITDGLLGWLLCMHSIEPMLHAIFFFLFLMLQPGYKERAGSLLSSPFSLLHIGFL
jgi:hypothetical protein